MSYVRVERPREGVALVTLDRPERMNAMAFDVMIPLREALEQVSRDNDVRAVVLTGAGGAFCSGADLENPGRVPDVDGDRATARTPCINPMVLADTDGADKVWLIGLWYDDELVRTADGWRFASRRQERCYSVTGLQDTPLGPA